MIECSQCGKALSGGEENALVASISGSVMGDEYTESYLFCRLCGVYTVAVFHDRFCGEETVSFRGPVPKAEGDAKVELIRQCPAPSDKKCRCEAHRSYFGSWLD